jgi:hypothetical protein
MSTSSVLFLKALIYEPYSRLFDSGQDQTARRRTLGRTSPTGPRRWVDACRRIAAPHVCGIELTYEADRSS